MAIAALPEPDELEIPWPRPILTVVREDHHGPATVAGPASPLVPLAPPVRYGTDVAQRRRTRASARVRRRRAGVVLVLALLALGLALPPSVFGGHPGAGHESALSGAVQGGPVTAYVVKQGDSLSSIARTFDPSDPAALERALVHETGSPVVVPGERLVVPAAS